MAFVARKLAFDRTRFAPHGQVPTGFAASTGAFPRIQPEPAEPAPVAERLSARPELVVVPLCEVIARLPSAALAGGVGASAENALVLMTPIDNVRYSSGPVLFQVAGIQQVCPHLFRKDYRIDPAATIGIPENCVFLGSPEGSISAKTAGSTDSPISSTSQSFPTLL